MPASNSIPALAIATMLLAAPAAGQTVDVTIDGNEAEARIALPGAVEALVTIRFEQVVGLTAESLGISASQVDPLSSSLLARLPDVEETTVPAGFPLMITVDPPADGGLSFEGIAELEIYTTGLHYAPATPLRLFKSSNGETFHDITDQVSGGSYRSRGSGGAWSDFLIVADTRPLEQTIDDKFARLQQVLDDAAGSISDPLLDQLQMHLDNAAGLYAAGDASSAIEELRRFESDVKAGADAGAIPNVWRSARDLENFDGELRAGSRTLRFSLALAGAGLL